MYIGKINGLMHRGGHTMYITITGELGSGKSTVAKLLTNEHGFTYYSTGSIQREIAKEKGITTLELNQLMTNDINNEYDKMIDDKTIEISRENAGKDLVFDSRMAWHFVDKSFKVYVTVDSYVAAKRVMNAGRGQEEQYGSVGEAVKSLLKRKQLEDTRFAEMYAVNTTDFDNYDLIIDSSAITPEELAGIILDKARNDDGVQTVYFSPLRLFPTCSMSDIDASRVDALCREDDGTAVEVVEVGHFYYIVSGHHKVCAHIRRKDKLVPVHMLKVDGNGYVEKYRKCAEDLAKISAGICKDWEKFNAIEFFGYPV